MPDKTFNYRLILQIARMKIQLVARMITTLSHTLVQIFVKYTKYTKYRLGNVCDIGNESTSMFAICPSAAVFYVHCVNILNIVIIYSRVRQSNQ